MGETGPNQSVIVALAAILQDSQSSLDLSCAAAKALGSFRIANTTNVDVAAIAFSMGQIAVDSYKAELARAERDYENRPIEPANRGFGGNPPGIAMIRSQMPGRPPVVTPGLGIRPGMPDAGDIVPPPPTKFISIQLLKSRLVCLEHGLHGNGPAAGKLGLLAAAAGTPREQFVVGLDTKLIAMIAVCDDTVTDYEALKNQISKAGGEIEGLLAGNSAGAKGRAPAAAPADTKSSGFDDLDAPAAPKASPPKKLAP